MKRRSVVAKHLQILSIYPPSLMDAHTYAELTGCDPSLTWSIVKEKVGEDFFGAGVIMVPFLAEAHSYNLLHVVVKEDRGTFNRLMRKPYSYRVIGHLDEVVSKKETNAKMLGHCKQPITEEQNLNQQYSLNIEDTQNGVMKSIKLKLNGCRKKISPLTMNQGDLVLDMACPGLEQARKIYVIVEVYVVDSLELTTRVGPNEASKKLTGEIPIGFTYQKFPLDSHGVVGPHIGGSKLTQRRSSTWSRRSLKRDPRDILPTTPAEDSKLNASLKPAKRNPKDGLPTPPGASTDNEEAPPVPPRPD